MIGCFGVAAPSFAADGAKLFAERCAACHGPKGEGTLTGPAQRGNPFITKGKPADIKKVIMEGRVGVAKKYPDILVGMPDGLASATEADELVRFLQGELQQ